MPELDQAEQLLLTPTAANVELACAALEQVAERLRLDSSSGGIGASTTQLARLKALLDAAVRLRLGLARVSVAGLNGYSADGHAREMETQLENTGTLA